MLRILAYILCICAIATAQNTFGGAQVLYRSGFAVSNTKLYFDTVRRRLVMTNYGGSDIVRVLMDGGASSAGQLTNTGSQGGGVIDSQGNYYTLSCSNNNVYLYSYDLTGMAVLYRNQTTLPCADVPSCMVLDTVSNTAVFTGQSSKMIGTVSLSTGNVQMTSIPSLNDNKFSCAYNALNRTAYFVGTKASVSAISMSTGSPVLSTIPITKGFTVSDSYSTPYVAFDSTNNLLYVTAASSKTTVARYSTLTQTWTSAQGDNGSPNGILVDPSFNTASVFTTSATLATADSNFTTTNAAPINVWSLLGVGYLDPSIATGSPTAYALDNDVSEIVMLTKSSAATRSFMIGIILSLFVTLFVLQ